MRNSRKLRYDPSPRRRDLENPPPPPWPGEYPTSIYQSMPYAKNRNPKNKYRSAIITASLGMLLVSMITADVAELTCQGSDSLVQIFSQTQKLGEHNFSRKCQKHSLHLLSLPLASASPLQDTEDFDDQGNPRNLEEIKRKIDESFAEYEKLQKTKKIKKNQEQPQVKIAWNPNMVKTYEESETSDTFDHDISTSKGRFLPDAPTPVIGSTFSTSITRSADCSSYKFAWSYTMITGNILATFGVQNLGSGSWNGILTDSNLNFKDQTLAELKSYGYYFGTTIKYRLRFKTTSYTHSDYYIHSVSDIMKSIPEAVTGVTVSQTMSAITVSWTGLATTWVSSTSPNGIGNDPVTYQIQKCLASSCTFANFGSSVSQSTIQQVFSLPDTTNLNWNTQYKFKIQATNICGTSSSSEATYTILSSVPNALATPTLETAYENTIKVSWTALTTDADQGYRVVTAYELSYCLSTTCPSPAVTTSPYTAMTETSALFYEQTVRAGTINWAFGSTYYFRVRARNAVGLGAYSTHLTVVMPRIPQAAPVMSLTSKNMVSIVVQWTELTTAADLGNNPLLYYQLQWSSSSTFASVTDTLTGAGYTSTSFTLDRSTYPYNAGTTYYFRVAVYNQAGLGPYSTIFNVLTPTVPVKMATPTAPTITPLSIVIQWTRLTSDVDMGYDTVTSYTLQQCTGSTTCTNFVTIATPDASQNQNTETYTIETTPRGVIIRYQIYATNNIGSSTVSDILTITTDNIPQSMTAVTCSSVTSTSMTLTWPALDVSQNGGDAITFYAVEYSVGGSAYSQLNTDYSNLYLTYTYSNGATNFPANTVYSFKVRAKNGIDYSNVYSTPTTCTTPTIPSGMTTPTHGTVTPKSIVINWAELTDTALNGRTPILYYRLEWWNAEIATPAWQELTSEADGKLLTYTHTRTTIFPSGSTQKYQILPKNTYDYSSAYSATLSVQADQVPINMNNPTMVSVNPGSISIQWSPITLGTDTGRDNVIFYHLYWDKGLGVAANDWQTLTDYPTSTTIITSFTHTLTTGTVFTSGSTQTYKVCAENGVGPGACGSVGITADSVPLANAPVIPDANIYPQKVIVTWSQTATANNGGDSIIYYQLQWDQGTGSWVDLNTYVSGMAVPTSYEHIPSAILSSGGTYKYRLKAQNGVGMGLPSTETSITADKIPQVNAPVIAVADIYPQKVRVTWTETATANNGGDPIISYKLQWDQGTGAWTDLYSYEAGKSLPTSYEHIPSAKLTSGGTYKYRLYSKNGVDFSLPSTQTSITADKIPQACNAPLIDVANIHPQQVTVTWNQIATADNGGDPIIFYLLQWDQGSNSWIDLNSYTSGMTVPTSYTHTPSVILTSGATYKYRLYAKNGVDYSLVSTETSITADKVPQACNAPVIDPANVEPQKVVITWNAINTADNGGDPINFYLLEWDSGTTAQVAAAGSGTVTWTALNTYNSASVALTYTHIPSAMLPAGGYIRYRLTSKNGVGYGPVSTETPVQCDDIPVKMATPQASMIRYNSIDLYWTYLTTLTETGRDPILYYRIEFFNRPCYATSYSTLASCTTGFTVSDGTWTDITSGVTTVQLSKSHTTSSFFSEGKDFEYRVRAINRVGSSQYSDTLIIRTPTRPTFMNEPTVDYINPKAISISWVPLSNSTQFAIQGNDIISYYTLEVNMGTGYSALNPTGSLITNYIHTSTTPFTKNVVFKYRVAASNGVGMGAYSSDLSITTDDVPVAVKNLAMVSTAPKQIKLSWDALLLETETGRDAVTYYKLEYHDNLPATTAWTELTKSSNPAVLTFQHDVSSPFPANLDQSNYYVKYRISATNGVEYGVTTELQVLTKTYPRKMNIATFADPTPSDVVINWVQLTTSDADTGRDPVIHYRVEWIKQTSTGSWTVLTNYPYTGSSKTVTTFSDNNWYRVRIAAQNGVGLGEYSDETLVLTDDVPNRLGRMPAPTEDSSTSATFIKINWIHLTDELDTGRDPVKYYRIYWDQGKGGSFTEMDTSPKNTMVLTYSWGTSIQNGTTYRFKVRPKNNVGDSFDSPILSVVPSSPPDRMATPVVTLANSDTMVKVTWTYPQDNGDDVSAYMVEFRAKDNTWSTLNDTCDGSLPSIVAGKYCYVHMQKLREAPFLLEKNDKIVVQINAKNIKGYNNSASPVANNLFTVVIETEPDAPGTPVRGSNTDYNVLETSWTGITSLTVAAGGITSSITSYEIQRNDGNTTAPDADRDTWISLQGFTSNNTATTVQTSTGIIGGTRYQLRARAYNKYGWGPWSQIYEITCARAPDAPTWISTENSTTNFLIKWQEPFNRGLQINRYYIAVLKKGDNANDPAKYIQTDDCPGDDPTINSTQQCTIKMTTLRSTTYLYSLNDKIRVRIWAENLMGQGAATILQLTATNNAMIQTQPSAPTTSVTNNPLITTDLQIKIKWAELPTVDSWGGIKIDTYEVWWYDPNTFSDYELLFTDNAPFKLDYTHTKTPTYDPGVAARAIIPGTLYKMKYRAINIHGEGSFSPETPIYASTIPDKLAPPITSLSSTIVTIEWAPTPNDHSQAVSKYAIRFKTSTGTFIEDSGCSGATPAIVAALKCSMAMTKFTSAPFNLNIDTLIEVTLDAYNVMGWSGQSLPNTIGVTAKKLPQTAPTGLARGINTGKNTMHLTWIGLTLNSQTGGQNVDYKIQYDKSTGQTTWSQLVVSTNNATSYQETSTVNFKTGLLYYFKVQAFNDFGAGPFSATFGIWAAIAPSGLGAPSTSLNYNSYTEEDDIVVVDWDPPTDNGGLAVTYAVDIMAKSGDWVPVVMASECYETNNAVTDFKMPLIPAADLGTRCTLMVTNLKSKYLLAVGDVVQARVTASHVVGFVTSLGGGTAVLPVVPCFRTTFPRIFGGSISDSFIRVMDVDDNGHIVVGGHTQDTNLLEGKVVANTVPIAAYIAKGNYYQWAKYLQTTDTTNAAQYQYVSDITFRWDGEKVALALDKANYDISYMIVVLNKDGTLYGAYREAQTNARAKVSPTGMIFDSSNMITVGLDFSSDGTSTKRQAVLNRFPVTQTAAATFNTQIYMIGGGSGSNMISQVFALQRIRGDTTQFYYSALITDPTGSRRAIFAKASFSNGAIQKNLVYSPGTYYNSDATIAVVKRFNLDENDLLQQHIIAACIMTQDNYRIHFGEFVFQGSSNPTQTVLTPNLLATYNTYNCLGTFSRTLGTLFFLYNYRFDPNPVNHKLILGRVTLNSKKLDQLQISSHAGNNQYGGARFIHMSRFYYFGTSNNIYNGNTAVNQPKYQGWINIFDPLEWSFHCNPTTQSFTIPSSPSINLDQVVPAQMDWKQTSLSTTTGFASSVTKQMRSLGTINGLFNLNLGDPMMNNTWCPIVTTGGGAPTLTAPSIANQMFTYNPDVAGPQTQSFQFDPITTSRFCPDTVIYNLTYLSKTNNPLPAFISLKGDNNSYVLDVSTTAHVGTYPMMLMSTLGNNKSASVEFTCQVASPCLNNPVAIPAYSIPIYDLSEWAPKYVDLDWVVTNSTPSCGSVYQIFQMVNLTNGGPIDPNIFTIVNQSSGIQRIQISTSYIPYTKLWSDLLVNSYLQGDFVASKVFTINITNDCAPTVISEQVMPNWVYYTGRDSIDLKFVWTETVGKCGPITYTLREYLLNDVSSNNTLDSSIFTYPSVANTNNTLKIFTADESKVGTYRIRVYASLGVGGYKQSNTIFTVQIIRDPCAYFTFTVPFIDDLTLWVNQTGQTVSIPFFKMSDPSWICNFTYSITTGTNTPVDPIFVKNEVVAQGTNPSISLVTTDKTKIDLSPYTVKVRGWPTRQPSSVAMSLQFRIFIAYLDRTDCPPGKYFNMVTENCEACASPCSQCINTPSKCTWCIDNFNYVEASNTCSPKTDPCPSGVKDPYLSICRKCSEFCKVCNDYLTCTSCIPNYSLANNKCYPPRNCPEGFTYNGAGCTECSTGCASCVSASVCNYCMQGYYLNTFTNQCVTDCPDGYYGDLQSRVCMVCSPACKTCVTNNYTCTSCQDITVGGVTTYKYLFKNTCVDRCPYLQYYQNHDNRSCDPCNSACMICTGAIDDCIVCNKGSVISGRSCLNSCPQKSYITVIGTCFPCDPACQICTGAMNSMCSECVNGQFLTQTTCEPKCMPPLFPDQSTKSCKSCLYYCNQCTTATDCQKCKAGYRQIPNNCEGEMFLRLNGQYQINVPINASLATVNPRQMTSEIWFKVDNPLSLLTEVILGTAPYKLRKKANLAQVQLNFDQINYCDSFNLKADYWYHFAYAINEEMGTLSCYLNGEKLSTGLASVGIISADIMGFREITFGGSIELKTSESKFTGYVKEFRWWKVVRTQFQILNFKDISFTVAPTDMYVYWRLDEDRKTQTAFKESVRNDLFTPTTPLTLSAIVEMREIFLKICPEGQFGQFNETSNMAECIKCDENCKNCNGPTSSSCTECVSPYKLIEAEQKCVIIEGCPPGYFEDVDLQCKPCHEYCVTCVNSPTQCPKCKSKYFKQYKGLGCVDSCPRGLYGNYITQACSANPVVTSLFPEDGSTFTYGDFIDLFATFDVLNLEQKETYEYGWIIKKLNGNVDLAKDAAKPYYGTDITRVHLDNNIIEPNNYYNITFYVKGLNTFYNGMLGSIFNVIYIGIPPKKGQCFIAPQQGIATVTTFKISTSGWVDVDGIGQYSFSYSYNNGETFIPIKTENSMLPNISVIFDPIFKTVSGQIRCSAKSIKGFTAIADTQFVLLKKSLSNAKIELAKLNVSKVIDEKDAVKTSNQIVSIAKDLGKLTDVHSKAFDLKIFADRCTAALCTYQGQCNFDSFTKKYFCKCDPGFAGVNCTFKNQTELEILRNRTLSLCQLYNPMSLSGRRNYDYQFLKEVTSTIDLMTDEIHDAIYDIVAFQINQLKTSSFNVGDNRDVTQNMNILSNMLEYQYQNRLMLNQTGKWKNMPDADAKRAKMIDDLNKTMQLVNIVKNSTLRRLSFLQTEIAVQTRMISYRQVLQNKDGILSMPATTGMKKQQQTYVKISPTNFINSSVSMTNQYIAEAIEYAINPYQLNNTDNVASNVFEVNLFNYNRTVDGRSTISRPVVKDLPVPIEFSFPVSNNQNLTEFLTTYNMLSNYKYSEVIKKDQMIKKSNLSCVYWDKVNSSWSKSGCQLQGVDKDHIRCNCTHLSAFTILFTTPKLTVDAPILENTTVAAESETRRNVTLKDIIKWPLNAYFSNLYKLWQHNRPSFLSFIIKPGFAVLILFWAMYFSSLIYYSGQDELKRFKMTKQQNRDDLAELKDDTVQNIMSIIKELIVKDFVVEHTKFIQKETKKMKQSEKTGAKRAVKPPQIMIYEQLSKEDQKKYRKRARRKVFGMPGGLCERAKRAYDITMKHNTKNPNAKMSFFNEELKNNLWIGLIAKTSKIAPRHVRLVLMYFYSSLYITLLTLIFGFGLQEYIADSALFQVVILALVLVIVVWIITIPVALIFRMPLHLRKMVAGVRTKKLNKAFQMVDAHMGWRYAIGYFICLTMFFLMTVVVLVFNIFYPHDYVMGWFFNIILIYVLDLIVFTFALAAFQMVCVIASAKIKCFYTIWKAIEVFRYVKNLRG